MTIKEFEEKMHKKFRRKIYTTDFEIIYIIEQDNESNYKTYFITKEILEKVPVSVVENAKTVEEVHKQLHVYEQIFKK